MSEIGTKRWVNIVGRKFPAIQMSEGRTEQVTPVGKTRAIPARFADLLSLRTTNPLGPDGEPKEVEEYLTITPENLRFSEPRFELFEGIDYEMVSGNPVPISHIELTKRLGDSIRTRQLARAALTTPVVVSDD